MLAPGDMHTVERAWGAEDRAGLGTGVAGIADYCDLTEPVSSSGPVQSRHGLESGKLVPAAARSDAHDPDLNGSVTIEADGRVEEAAPEVGRTISPAVTTGGVKKR